MKIFPKNNYFNKRGKVMLKKMIQLIFDSGLDQQILQILKNLNIQGYTKIANVKGAGTSGFKFGNSVGPGENNMIITVIEEKQVARLKSQITVFKKNLMEKQGLKLFILPVEESI